MPRKVRSKAIPQHVLPLEKGLIISAYREGMAIHQIRDAMVRGTGTIHRILRIAGVLRSPGQKVHHLPKPLPATGPIIHNRAALRKLRLALIASRKEQADA